jgi:A/G-specific adenine glycosylase
MVEIQYLHQPRLSWGGAMVEVVEADGHPIDAAAFRKALIAWGREHPRPFPWRSTEDPYHILMAEVMLHRTQAPQVTPVYEQFIARYPDVPALARATKEELHDALYSLGLRWRIDLIQAMAAALIARFDGRVPHEKADLLSLLGVSEYIAGAVRCFTWNLTEPLMDTNTVRVVGRLFGLEIKDSSRRNRQFRELITALVDPNEPRVYNYALLDLAEQVCMKKRPPACGRCPVSSYCMCGTNALAERAADQGNQRSDG